jgi:hypothetical protein
VLVPQDRVIAAPRFFHGTIDDPLRRLSDLVRGDIEVFHVRGLLPPPFSKRKARACTDDERPHKRLMDFKLRCGIRYVSRDRQAR